MREEGGREGEEKYISYFRIISRRGNVDIYNGGTRQPLHNYTVR